MILNNLLKDSVTIPSRNLYMMPVQGLANGEAGESREDYLVLLISE
jgi:hypothetical protein